MGSLDLPIQRSIELLTTCRDPNTALANLTKFSCSNEASCSWLHDIRDDKIAEVKYLLTDSFFAVSLIFSTLVSEKPLILRSLLVVHAHKVWSRD
jgi:hypothetical protein